MGWMDRQNSEESKDIRVKELIGTVALTNVFALVIFLQIVGALLRLLSKSYQPTCPVGKN